MKWWADSMDYCYLRNVQDLFSDRTTPYKRRFGVKFSGPRNIIRFLQKTRHLHWGKCRMLEASEKKTFWSRMLRSSKFWTRRKSTLGESMRRKCCCRKAVTTSNSVSQMEQSSWLEEIRSPEDPSQVRIIPREMRSTTMFFRESRTGLNHQTIRRMTLKPHTIYVVFL